MPASGNPDAAPARLPLALSVLGLILADVLLTGIILTLVGGFVLERLLAFPALERIASLVFAGYALARGVLWGHSRHRWAAISLPALGNLATFALYCLFRSRVPGGVSRLTFAEVLLVAFAVQALLRLLQDWSEQPASARGGEALRWSLIGAALLVLHHPLLTNGSVGAGDAYWYSIMVADFTSQWRDGVFPVFVGQSEFAFNGAVNPVRFAPYLQHLTGVIDLATFHSLPFYGLLNLALVGSFIGGALSCYFCLRAIEPRAPWIAVMLSLLYSACPGVLGLAYAGDLFMSITTLPYIPLMLYGAWRSVARGDRGAMVAMIAGAAALWYCHPPIALWGTAVAAAAQGVRLFRDGGKRETWRQWGWGALAFIVLTAFCFVSVATLHLPSAASNRAVLIENLFSAYPAALEPVSTALRSFGDYQLGWSLWAILLGGFLCLWFRRPWLPALALSAGAALLIAFILPTPVLKTLWSLMPQMICDITYMWPMQRFYVLLAALSVFISFIALAPLIARHGLSQLLVFLLLVRGAIWSGEEAIKFQKHAYLTTTPPAAAQRMQLPQNHILTRYAFSPFPNLPPYFSHGFIDPRLENRLRDAQGLKVFDGNTRRVDDRSAVGQTFAEGNWVVDQPDAAAPTLRLRPELHLEAGRQYILHFDFTHPDFTGAMIINGPRFNRVYWLPSSGYGAIPTSPSTTFGALPGQTGSIVLWTDLAQGETLNLQFFFTDPASVTGKVTDFGHYQLAEFNPAALPIAVRKWSPYQARVKSDRPAYLETPRLYLEGYRAKVDGHEVPVSRSPDALVMLPVPAGESDVRLSYSGPLLLRLAYFVSLAAWIMLVAAVLRPRWRQKLTEG